jgi:hypothetical protein
LTFNQNAVRTTHNPPEAPRPKSLTIVIGYVLHDFEDSAMTSFKDKNSALPSHSRRIFLQGLAAGGVMTAVGLTPQRAFADTPTKPGAPELRGTEFDLVIDEMPVNFS